MQVMQVVELVLIRPSWLQSHQACGVRLVVRWDGAWDALACGVGHESYKSEGPKRHEIEHL